MLKLLLPALASLALLAGCGGSSSAADAGACAATKAFGEACTDNCECTSGDVCFAFGDGTQTCTLNCTSSDQCPSGSQGQKCNAQGVCRP